ncbi:uncharacterized protein LOC144132393 isoform X2 [Amblyomma americanum]
MASPQQCTMACEQLHCFRRSREPQSDRASMELLFVDDDLEDCDLSCSLYESPLRSPLDACETPESAMRSLPHHSSRLESLSLKASASLPTFLLTPSPLDALNVPKKDVFSKRHHSSGAKSPRETRSTAVSGEASTQPGSTALQSAASGQDDSGAVQSSGNLYPHSCRTCYGHCLKKLMTLCECQDIKKFEETLRPSFQGSKVNKIEETVDSETYIVDTGNKARGPADTVLQLFVIDTHSASRVYSSVFSCKKLSDLHGGLNNKCFGFRLIRRIVLVQDMLPENFAKAYDQFARSHPRCYQPHPDTRPKDQRYLVVEADYSGPSILQSKLKPAQAISIIGQVACCLAVAERELEFEHRNLHEENIRVLPSTSKNHHFLIDGRTCCVKGAGIKVTLFDDNFGRMMCNNEIIIRMRNYNCVYKEKTAIYLTMERIIKDRWDLFHSETNALWLAYLCGHLSDYLTVPNPTGDWQRKLELLAFMQRDLHRFHSADEFVWNYINKIGHVHSEFGYQPHTCSSRPSAGPPIYAGFLNFLRWKDRKRKDGDSGGSPGSTSGRPGGGGGGASSAPAVLDGRRQP